MMRVVVIGIGQSLRGDDAVGLEAVRQWRERYPETANRSEVRIEAAELPGLSMLDMFEDTDAAILVDAVHGPALPGTLHLIHKNDLSTFTTDAKSAHGWGVAETLEIGRLLGKLDGIPIRLIGIEVGEVHPGSGLSNSIHDSLPATCQAIQAEVLSIINN